EPAGAIVGPRRSTRPAQRSFVDVLPDDPVIPATTADGSESRTERASRARASTTEPPTTQGKPGTATVPSTPTAPAATAAAAKLCPSTRSPTTATNIEPGGQRREAITNS